MKKIRDISIIASFAALWITSLFSGDFETLAGFILIFSFGILHGSNDILLVDAISETKNRPSFSKVLLIYVLTIGLAVITFYYLPILALILFILFSAFHFGEQHWEYQLVGMPDKISFLFYLVYGLLILTLLFVLNPNEVIEVIYAISNFYLTPEQLSYAFFLNLGLFSIFCIKLILHSRNYSKIILKEILLLLILVIIFKVSTLIWAFAIYFIFWHSIPSLYQQVSFIYGKFTPSKFLKYCKNAFPYWSISLIGISFVYFLLKDSTIFYAIFFSFIAAVTFPHALVINKMFQNKKTRSNR